MAVTLVIGKRHRGTYRDFLSAREAYEAERNKSGEGASSFPSGTVWEPYGPRVTISYNGRFWLNDKPIWEDA